MELQGRNLSSGMQGDDVKLLQAELVRLGFVIADSELQRATFAERTREAVQTFQKSSNLPVTGVVDAATAKAMTAKVQATEPQPTLIVRGQVLSVDGKPVAGNSVRAFDQDLRSEEMLGETKTGTDGRYEISYKASQFRRAEKKSADLVVRVLDDRGQVRAA